MEGGVYVYVYGVVGVNYGDELFTVRARQTECRVRGDCVWVLCNSLPRV